VDGRPAYITSLLPGEYDIKLADDLNLPLFNTSHSAIPQLSSRATTLSWLQDNKVPFGSSLVATQT
jgi:hypothetical protein